MNGKALYAILVTLGLAAAGAIWQASAAFTKADETAKTVDKLTPVVTELYKATAVLNVEVQRLIRTIERRENSGQ